MLGLSFNYELSQKFKHDFEENVFLLVKKMKKTLDDILFEILPFRIFYHLFYCHKGFYVFDKCVFCTKFHVRKRHLSDYLNNALTYPRNYFCDFKEKIFLKKISLFAHYHGIIYSSRYKNFANDYGNCGVLYYEQIDRLFYFINLI